MKDLILSFAVAVMRFVNLFFKPLKLKDKVVIISRQSDTPTMDIKMLQEELQKRNIKVQVLTKTLHGPSYVFHMASQMKAIATSKVVVLDGYCILASVLPKKKGQKIVQMWHSLGAIKKFGWQSAGNMDGHSPKMAARLNMHGNYDYFLATSEETGRFFAEAFKTPFEKRAPYGLPRIDFIRGENPQLAAEILKEYPEAGQKPIVLYVPTFRKNAAVAMEKLVAGFDFESFNLVIKKHFLDKGDYSFAREKGAIVEDKFGSLDWMKVSQKVVTDYSAISLEAALAEKELYIFQPDAGSYSDRVGINMDLASEAIGPYFSTTEEELFQQLKAPYDMEKLIAFRDKYFEIPIDNCTADLGDFIQSLLAKDL